MSSINEDLYDTQLYSFPWVSFLPEAEEEQENEQEQGEVDGDGGGKVRKTPRVDSTYTGELPAIW